MNVQYFFKRMDTSNALIEYTNGKMDQLSNMLDRNLPITVRVESSGVRQKVHISCFALDKSSTQITVRAENMYQALDSAVEKLNRILRKKKERMMEKRSHTTPRSLNEVAVHRENLERAERHTIDADTILTQIA